MSADNTFSDNYPNTGLTEAEVLARKAQGLVNTPVKPPSKSAGQIVFSNIFTYFNLVYSVFAVILLSIGSYRDRGFMGVIVCNTLIGIVQELRSKKVLDQLALLDVSEYVCLRDGEEKKIPSDRLVLGDVIRLKIGQQIPADAVVLDGEAGVNESLLTGEEDEVECCHCS